jgi:hypothetical protein
MMNAAPVARSRDLHPGPHDQSGKLPRYGSSDALPVTSVVVRQASVPAGGLRRAVLVVALDEPGAAQPW